jgi:hypothetical protein
MAVLYSVTVCGGKTYEDTEGVTSAILIINLWWYLLNLFYPKSELDLLNMPWC